MGIKMDEIMMEEAEELIYEEILIENKDNFTEEFQKKVRIIIEKINMMAI